VLFYSAKHTAKAPSLRSQLLPNHTLGQGSTLFVTAKLKRSQIHSLQVHVGEAITHPKSNWQSAVQFAAKEIIEGLARRGSAVQYTACCGAQARGALAVLSRCTAR
jgi:hypothetical protein